MPLPQKMPSRSGSMRAVSRPAFRTAARAACSAIAVPRSSGTREGAACVAASKLAAATGTGGKSMPGRSRARARTADVPANRAASNRSRSLPSGLTTPAPLTDTGTDRHSARGGAIFARLGSHGLVEQVGKTFEGDAGLARIEAVFRDADLEAIFHREDELHQGQRVEAEVLEGGIGQRPVGLDVELVDQHGGDGVEGRSVHAGRLVGAAIEEPQSMPVPTPRMSRQNRHARFRRATSMPSDSLALPFADIAAPLAERLRPTTLDEVIGQRQ